MSIASRTRSRCKKAEEDLKQEEAISRWRKLPVEVIQYNIFLKLPGISILSSRCVCKLFNDYLSQPIFIKNHVNISIQNKTNPKLLFSNFFSMMYTLPIDYASISSAKECKGAILMNYPFQSDKSYYHQFLGSCNGLICFKICRTESRNFYDSKRFRDEEETNYFSILNPFTGEFKEFTMQTVNKYGYDIAYGFGYDTTSDDYKLVAISDNVTTRCSVFEVYKMRSNSRTSVEQTHKYSFHDGKRSRATFFNGCLHWVGWIATRKRPSEAILCYDFSNGIMVNIPLPENLTPPTGYVGEGYKNVGVWGDCLCVALVWDHLRTVDVWVMQEYRVKESWFKKYTITQLPSSYLLPLWKPLWSFDNGVLVDYDGQRLLLFDPTTETVRSVVSHGITLGGNQESYVESIASLGSGTYLERRITGGTVKNPRRRRLR